MPSKHLKAIPILLLTSSMLLGCSNKPEKKPGPPAKIPAFNQKKSPLSPIRLQAVKETAMTVGSQGGLAWRSLQINKTLQKNSAHLFRVFNFQQMLLKNNVLPPVLTEGQRALNLADNESIRVANRVYKIVSPPRFVTAPPTWKQYLWMSYEKPEEPDPTLLPRTALERKIWNQYINIGWDQGIALANQIYTANLNRLKRNFEGMALYRVLLAQNMVTPPYVAKTDLGVTGDEKEMRIDDRVLRISATSKLNTDSKTWKPVIYDQKSSQIDQYRDKIDK